MAKLKHIRIYPVKSLDPVCCQQSVVLANGALQHDRRFALIDTAQQLVNGKRNERVHSIHLKVNLETWQMQMGQRGGPQSRFDITQNRNQIETWLSDYFEQPIRLVEDTAGGFPDDTAAPGPTLISTATLEAVTEWYPELSVEELRLRVRANLEIDGVPAFWEDRLCGLDGQAVPFRIGAVIFRGINSCQRCVVLMRNSQTGVLQTDFKAIFSERREQCLPDWAERSRFNHFFRLAVNTSRYDVPDPPETEHVIRVGDEVSIF